MGLLTRFKGKIKKIRNDRENKVISRIDNAEKKIKQLEERRKILDQRENTLNRAINMKQEVKDKEQAVRDLNYKNSHPTLYKLGQKVKERVEKAKNQRVNRIGPNSSVRTSVGNFVARNSTNNRPMFADTGNNPFVGGSGDTFRSMLYSKPKSQSKKKRGK